MTEPERMPDRRAAQPASARRLDRRSIEDRAVEVLRQRFLAGEYAYGERLTEQSLAADLAVSRGPVRAALQRLAQENLVVLRPYCGWEVARPSRQDAWELSTLRSGLEELACQLAATRLDGPAIARLREAHRELGRACRTGNAERICDADFGLHRLIVDLSGNKRLRQSYIVLEQQVRFLVAAVNEPFTPDFIAESHDEMIEALCRGDGDTAAAACREHHAVMVASSRPPA